MSKRKQGSAVEKLAILQELETGQASRIARKYDVDLTTIREWRNSYNLYGYEDLETGPHNNSYPAELSFRGLFWRIVFRLYRIDYMWMQKLKGE